MQRLETGTGLYDYNARFYDPALGRFIQADTIVPDIGSPQTLNRYMYTRGNPLKYNDPTGHDVGCVGMDCSVYARRGESEQQLQVSEPAVRAVPTLPVVPTATPVPSKPTPLLTLMDPNCVPFRQLYFDTEGFDEFGVAVDVAGMLGESTGWAVPEGTAAWFISEGAEFVTVVQDTAAAVSYFKALQAGEADLVTRESVYIGLGLTLDLVSLMPIYGTYANSADIGKEVIFAATASKVLYICPDAFENLQPTPVPERVPVPME